MPIAVQGKKEVEVRMSYPRQYPRRYSGSGEGFENDFRFDANRTDYDDRYPTGTMRAPGHGGRATPWDRGRDPTGYAYDPADHAGPAARERAHFDEHRSWDPEDQDAFWRRGEYGSRLYGNVRGATTPTEIPGIRRSHAGRAGRMGPKGYARSDERLFDDICERLSHESWIDPSEVEVHVNDGHVRLEGEVFDRFSKHAIEDIADSAWGVKDIENHLRIRAR